MTAEDILCEVTYHSETGNSPDDVCVIDITLTRAATRKSETFPILAKMRVYYAMQKDGLLMAFDLIKMAAENNKNGAGIKRQLENLLA